MEEWRDIPGYEGLYAVSSEGRIKSYGRVRRNGLPLPGRILKNNCLRDGYCQVALTKLDGSRKDMKVHRLVAMAFIPNPENKPHVNHKNGIRDDNRVSNLEWATISENHLHAFRELGKKPTRYWLGKPNPGRKLTQEQVAAIIGDKRSQVQIAKDYGVCQQTISNIKTGKFYVDW